MATHIMRVCVAHLDNELNSMIYHVLNGDALAGTFEGAGIPGEVLIAREGLIAGNLQGDTLAAFFETRAQYLSSDNPRLYYDTTVKEFNKLLAATDGSEFNLWFGYDLFCQVNMWFILSLLKNMPVQKNIFVVYPSFRNSDEIWKDFGRATHANLHTALTNRVAFAEKDLQLADDLWLAYKQNDLERLQTLAQQKSSCFPYLAEVCQAHVDRFPLPGAKGRPERVIEDIIKNVSPDFHTVFVEFFKREGVYGFGDDQLKPLYDKVISAS
jgi:hypothetical protein